MFGVAAAAMWLTVPPLAAAQNVTQLPTHEGNMSENLTIPDRARHTNGADREFAGAAANAARRQMADAKAALRESERSDVKQIAATLLGDGERMGGSLAGISSRGDFVATTSNTGGQATEDSYSDRTFIADQIEMQRNAIKRFEREGRLGGNHELKNFARVTLPLLQRNLQALQALTVD
jgi:predicted outer membrane protein